MRHITTFIGIALLSLYMPVAAHAALKAAEVDIPYGKGDPCAVSEQFPLDFVLRMANKHKWCRFGGSDAEAFLFIQEPEDRPEREWSMPDPGSTHVERAAVLTGKKQDVVIVAGYPLWYQYGKSSYRPKFDPRYLGHWQNWMVDHIDRFSIEDDSIADSVDDPSDESVVHDELIEVRAALFDEKGLVSGHPVIGLPKPNRLTRVVVEMADADEAVFQLGGDVQLDLRFIEVDLDHGALASLAAMTRGGALVLRRSRISVAKENKTPFIVEVPHFPFDHSFFVSDRSTVAIEPGRTSSLDILRIQSPMIPDRVEPSSRRVNVDNAQRALAEAQRGAEGGDVDGSLVSNPNFERQLELALMVLRNGLKIEADEDDGLDPQVSLVGWEGAPDYFCTPIGEDEDGVACALDPEVVNEVGSYLLMPRGSDKDEWLQESVDTDLFTLQNQLHKPRLQQKQIVIMLPTLETPAFTVQGRRIQVQMSDKVCPAFDEIASWERDDWSSGRKDDAPFLERGDLWLDVERGHYTCQIPHGQWDVQSWSLAGCDGGFIKDEDEDSRCIPVCPANMVFNKSVADCKALPGFERDTERGHYLPECREREGGPAIVPVADADGNKIGCACRNEYHELFPAYTNDDDVVYSCLEPCGRNMQRVEDGSCVCMTGFEYVDGRRPYCREPRAVVDDPEEEEEETLDDIAAQEAGDLAASAEKRAEENQGNVADALGLLGSGDGDENVVDDGAVEQETPADGVASAGCSLGAGDGTGAAPIGILLFLFLAVFIPLRRMRTRHFYRVTK